MVLISVKAVREGEDFPPAIIGFHQIDLAHRSDDLIENSHCLRIAIPLFHYGQVWSYAYNGRQWGFKWCFLGLRMTDIISKGRHIWEWKTLWYIGLMR